jgi:curli production assembly/transport component CsgE
LLPLLATSSFAQRTAMVTAWVDIQSADGNAIISSWCQNHTPSPLHLRYKALLINKDTLIKEGKTLAIPDQPNLLLNASFLVQGGQFDFIQLFIFKNDELVAKAELQGPKQEVQSLKENIVRSPNPDRLNADDIEIEGLVLDETRSKLAHDFYELFYASWRVVEEDLKTNYSIIIREQPAFVGNGSRIAIDLDGIELTQMNLQPRQELMEQLSVQLVEMLYNQIKNPDAAYQEIGAEDISGSGIY